ncbi:MAG: monovalent cation/H(+) antiporter subunit G [Lachnospiraceae bacterium]|jgi:multicomponent Na+:H+ antiporter subunit G|nr:monovalent cation/H(+) antiporter subunit G [Lachnospiraceae bacterium]MBR6238494.1 monovalent cation/H(+) antiporter subunit G [Lachnospiraceae bacterium]
MEWIRLIIGGAFLLIGLIIFVVEIYGVFHMKYVLNRMQAAALGDTLGLSSSLIGLMIYSGLNMTTLKIALIVVFLWFSSPVASHLLARLEVTTNEDIDTHAKRYDI